MPTVLTIVLLSVLLGVGIWFGVQSKFTFRRGLPKGSEVAGVGGVIGEAISKGETLMLYLYNPNSALCRIQTLAIDDLQKDFRNIYRVDVSRNVRLARQLRVVQTPTVIIIGDGKVKEFLAGVKDEETLRRYL